MTASGTVVSGGTSASISAGQSVAGLTVQGGATLVIDSSAAASDTVIFGGETVLSGGGDDAALILSGGVQIIQSGGVANGAIVGEGGSEIVSSGGIASNAVISGGTLELAEGGALSGALVFAGGGTLQIDGTTMPAATISGFADTGQTIDLRGFAFDNAGSAVLTAGNVLQISEGGQTVSLNLDPSQSYAGHGFALASDGHGGTTVVDPTAFNNLQPSLGIAQLMLAVGSSSGVTGTMLGFVYDLAANVVPKTSLLANGQLFPVAQNPPLFALLGATYGGDGRTTFALPNLQGEATVGTGAGYLLGERTGQAAGTLVTAELPPPSGTSQPFVNLQPSLVLQPLIAITGPFGTGAAFIGQIRYSAGSVVPSGWAAADGSLLSIANNAALFSLIGTTYGGDGVTTFALPNLQGRLAVGADASHPIGSTFGESSTSLVAANLPSGADTPVNNDQPSLAVQYLIATSGIIPITDGGGFDPNTATLGGICAFAGNSAPDGWALCDGSLLSIASNTTLFNLIGTTFGGDGINTFALSDLRGRTLIGPDGSNYFLGGTYGADTTTLTAANIPCFCRGTRIATERGEVQVEELVVGDRVRTWSSALKPVQWIGFGRDLVTERHTLARPIIVKRGALADGMPRRDLYLTHGHALYLDGVLIPVENLVNHRSIVWDETARVVEYYHIELADHDVVFAEGAPAETYYDADNRALFHDTRPGSTEAAAAPTFAPVLNGGAVVERVWAKLFERSGGPIERDNTADPDLHLVADGKRLDPSSCDGGIYTFTLAAPPAGALRLLSRSAVPSHLGIIRHDHRRLGVAISKIELRAPGTITEFAHDAWLFRDGGCYPAEDGWAWTDGEFDLPKRLITHLIGAFSLTVHIERPGMRYLAPAALADAA